MKYHISIRSSCTPWIILLARRSSPTRSSKAPPYPEFRLFSVERRIYPKTARDGHGADVLPQLIARDQRYPDHFRRSETGVADLHSLDLDFGSVAPSGKAILVLNGWVDWPDGSTFRRAAQESEAGLVMPYLQVQDARRRLENREPGYGHAGRKAKDDRGPGGVSLGQPQGPDRHQSVRLLGRDLLE